MSCVISLVNVIVIISVGACNYSACCHHHTHGCHAHYLGEHALYYGRRGLNVSGHANKRCGHGHNYGVHACDSGEHCNTWGSYAQLSTEVSTSVSRVNMIVICGEPGHDSGGMIIIQAGMHVAL